MGYMRKFHKAVHMKKLKELTREYLQLSDLSQQQSLSDEFIFQEIAEFD